MSKRIPKSFQLGGYTFKVQYCSDEELERKAGQPAYGLFDPGNLTIWLQKPDRETKRAIIYQTFWHEVTHALLWTAGHKQYGDEKLVDQLGHYLAQLSITQKYT